MTTKPTEAMLDAGARALMLADGCGLMIDGERVLCTDLRARIPATECICRDGAKAAIEAALAAVDASQNGEGTR